MPQVIVEAAYYLWLGVNAVAGAGALSQAAAIATVQFIAVTAASMAASKLLAPKMPSFSDSSLSERGQMVRSPIAARSIIYGRCRVSGTIVYISTTGTKNEYLHLVVALAGHEVEAIDTIYFNDEEVPLSGNQPTGFYSGVALINKKRGVPNDTADADLIAATASLTDGKWTADHKLSGIAYLYVRLTWDAEKYPSGIPNISAVVRGRKVFDPRTSTTAYSANAALCLRDYLTNSLGMGMTTAEMDDTAFGAAANICDENVEIKPVTTPTPTEENRYEANGVVSTSASPDENIGKLLSAMGGLIAYTGGKIAPYAAAYRIPTVTFSEKHFVGPISVQTRTSARDRVNSVKGVYLSEINNWQVTDFPTITDATYVSDDNGSVFFRDVVLPFTTSSSCAQRLAVIELRRAREEITMSARFRLEAMQVRAGDTVMITNAKLGFSSKVFEVMEWNFASGGNPPEVFVDMTLRETDSSVYSWNVTDEIYTAGALNTTLPDPFTISAPTNLTLTANGTTQLIQADGTALPRILVAWTAPAEAFIQSGGVVGIEYKESTSATYLTWSRVGGDQTRDFISSDVKIGLTYDVRIYGESYFGVSTSYLTAQTGVVKDTTAPSIPTGLAAAVGTGRAVSLDWNDNTEPDFSEYGIYRNTTAVTPANANTNKIAEVRASRFVDTEVTIGTTYYYWLNAYDTVENVSGFAAYVEATPVVITAGPIDSTPPSTPSAPTFVSESTYSATDGGTFAKITIAAPALPTGARVNQVLYRVSGSTEFIIACELTAAGNATIDDLTVGAAYEIAIRAVSFSNVRSTVSSTLSRTAPSNTTASANPTGFTAEAPSATNLIPPRVFNTSQMLAATVRFTRSTSRDVSYMEFGASSSNVTAPVSFSYRINESEVEFFYYTTAVANAYLWVRTVNSSNVASTAVYTGLNMFSYIAIPAATMITQNADDINTTGIKTGGGSSTLQVNVVYEVNSVVTLLGGNTTENVNISLTNRGFSAKPDDGLVVVEDVLYQGFYDSQSASSTSTNAVIKIYRNDGGTLASGPLRLSARFTDYN